MSIARSFLLTRGSIVLLVVLGLVGCRPASEPATDNQKPAADSSAQAESPAMDRLTAGGVKPAKDDTLLLSYANDPDTINPLTANDTASFAFQRQVYESLAESEMSDPDKLLPALATDWEFDEKTLTYTIHLRKGVKWHPMKLPNGKPLPKREFTSRDVKFTFDCILNPYVEAAHTRSYYEDPEAEGEADRYKIKVSVVDDYTVKIQWTKPYFMADQFTLEVPIIPRHVFSVDENGEPISFDFSSKEFADGFNNHWANNQMCGTGPMVFTDWTRDSRVVLKRFDDYWGAPFYFSQIVYRCIPNPNTVIQKGMQGELDQIGIPQKDKFFQLKDNSSVKEGKVRLVDYEYPGYRYIGYNLRRKVFQDQKFRQAMAHAVPVQKIIDEVFEGLAIRVAGPFLPGSSQADPSIKPIPYDLDRARVLLDEAGWKDTDADGVRDKVVDGQKIRAEFEILIYSDSPSFRTIGEIVKENGRKIGIEVKITPVKWALFLQKLRKWDFDAAMLGWATSWRKSDPFQIWHGSQADIKDSSNAIGYRNPEVDRLIEELRVTMDTEKQVELFHKIFRLIYEDQPYTFLFSEKRTGAIDSRIENVKFYRIRPCTDAREWYSDRPRIISE